MGGYRIQAPEMIDRVALAVQRRDRGLIRNRGDAHHARLEEPDVTVQAHAEQEEFEPAGASRGKLNRTGTRDVSRNRKVCPWQVPRQVGRVRLGVPRRQPKPLVRVHKRRVRRVHCAADPTPARELRPEPDAERSRARREANVPGGRTRHGTAKPVRDEWTKRLRRSGNVQHAAAWERRGCHRRFGVAS